MIPNPNITVGQLLNAVWSELRVADVLADIPGQQQSVAISGVDGNPGQGENFS